MRRGIKVIKTVDKEGREVITYLKSAPARQSNGTKRKTRNEAIRVTLKLPR
jgi:hypothetical protein